MKTKPFKHDINSVQSVLDRLARGQDLAELNINQGIDREYFVNEERGMGPLLRAGMIREAWTRIKSKNFNEFPAALNDSGHKNENAAIGGFSYGGDGDREADRSRLVTEESLKAFVVIANGLLPDGEQPRTYNDLFRSKISGPDAAQRYHSLVTGIAPPNFIYPRDSDLEDRIYFRNEGDERDEFLDTQARLLFSKSTGDQLRIHNIYNQNSWNGLTAFAGALYEQYKQKSTSLRFVYINLRGTKKASAPDYYRLVDAVHAAFTTLSIAQNNETSSEEDAERKVQEIRYAMLESSALMVFDGYFQDNSQDSAIHNVIRDDRLPQLLRTLSTPILSRRVKTCPGSPKQVQVKLTVPPNKTQLRTFLNNRILILSNASVCTLADATIQTQTSVDMSELVTHSERLPDTQHREEVVLALEFTPKERKQITEICKTNKILLSLAPNEAITALHCTMQLFGLEPKVRSDWTLKDKDLIASSLTFQLLDHLYKNQRDQFASLLLVACCPGGIRPISLRKLCATFMDKDNHSRNAVTTFQRKMRLLLDNRYRDYIPEIFSSTHKFEQLPSREIASQESDREEKSIGLKYAEIAPFIHSYCSEKPAVYGAEQSMLARAHSVLSEESFYQQRLIAKHEPNKRSDSIRNNRRQVQGIYHALYALPNVQPYPILFSKPKEQLDENYIWNWLWNFAYRASLERPPTWRISRSFGCDKLKHTLSQKFLETMRQLDIHPAAEVVADIEVSRAIAEHSLGLAITPTEISSDSSIAFAIWKRRCDEHLLRQRDEQLTFEQALAKNPDDFDHVVSIILAKINDLLLVVSFKDQLESLVNDIREVLLGEHNAETHETASTRLQDFVELIINDLEPSGEFARFVDCLQRLGEYFVIQGEYRLLEDKETEPVLFLVGFSCLYVSESIRGQFYTRSVEHTDGLVSGHFARLLIRCALRLHTWHAGDDESLLGKPGYFALEARRIADTYSRHLHFLEKERLSILLTEATFCRLLTTTTDDSSALCRGLEMIEHGETFAANLESDYRLWLRVRWEQSKHAARLAEKDVEHREEWQLVSQIYARRLQRLADKLGLPLWEKLALHQLKS